MKLTLAAMSTVLFLANSLGAQTIINGGFEADPVTPGGYDPITPTGWTLLAGDPWVTSVTAPDAVVGASGDNYLQAGGFMIISQDISGLTVGADYEITYLFGKSDYPAPQEISVNVSIAGVNSGHYDGSLLPFPMSSYSIIFTATSTIETLYITSKTATASFDIFDITPVTPIPEPSSVFLIGLGGLALLAKRRR